MMQLHQDIKNLVADSDHFLADKYGQEIKILKLGRMPSQLVLDKDENIIFKHYAKSMRDIVANDVVLDSV